MANYIIATIKTWNIENSKKLAEQYPEHNFQIITEEEKLT